MIVEAGPIAPEGGASCVTASCPLKVQMETPTPDPTTISQRLNIANAGSTTVDLANVRAHYYFTTAGATLPLALAVDYAGYSNGMTGFSSANVAGVFVSMGANSTAYADTYLELSFTGTLPATSAISVNFRIHDPSFHQIFNPANDWSSAFTTSNATTYVDANYVTAYLSGTLAWGTEPGALPPRDAGPSPRDAGDGG
jgi:hypothetical protein